MPYAYGHNFAGYLPESDVHYVRDFDDAKAGLISDLLFAAEYEDSEDLAENLTNAAEDANLWGEMDEEAWLVRVDLDRSIPMAYWIHEVSEEEYEQNADDI